MLMVCLINFSVRTVCKGLQQFELLCSNFRSPSKRFSHLKMYSISNVCNGFNCFARPILYLNWIKVFLWQINVFLHEIFLSLSRFLYIIPFHNVWAPKVEAGIMVTLCLIFGISLPWYAYKGHAYKTKRVYSLVMFKVILS